MISKETHLHDQYVGKQGFVDRVLKFRASLKGSGVNQIKFCLCVITYEQK